MTGNALYLRHIVDAIERIRSYTGEGKEAFLANSMVQDATIRNLEVIVARRSNKSPPNFAAAIRTFHGRKWPACGTS